jgi:FixJ family two-component response regulator
MEMVIKGGTIVIIDDDPGMGRAIERLCNAADLPTSCYISAEDYLESGDATHTAGLVLDIHLPGMTGFQLDEWLKQHDLHIPTVFITGHDQAHLQERALRSGAIAVFHKPFKGEELLGAIRHFFDGAR